ncbi:MAG: hypothetical protein WD250_06400 [Egibacteraceae bacterium]
MDRDEHTDEAALAGGHRHSQADARMGEKAVRATVGGVAAGAGVGGAVDVVGAHTDHADELNDAIEALRRHDPRKLHPFDAEGNEIAA